MATTLLFILMEWNRSQLKWLDAIMLKRVARTQVKPEDQNGYGDENSREGNSRTDGI